MNKLLVTRDEVIGSIGNLPGFPPVIAQILETLDDPEANMNFLVGHIQHDPVIAARVFSLANRASRSGHYSETGDLYAAVSLIGLNSVRDIAMTGSISGWSEKFASGKMPASYWSHSVAAGVCAQELARHIAAAVPPSTALIAGLLRDVGQLWLYCFDAGEFGKALDYSLASGTGIEVAERERFGVDHATIGAWLAEHWSLPANICAAIRHHHAPDSMLGEPLVPLVHVAEVLSNALDLTGRDENRVTAISARACKNLGLVWDGEIRPLFGQIEASSRYANTLIQFAGTIPED
jgi:HD-like signal output (HDOD) protein